VTKEELKFKIDCAVDLYATEHAIFEKGYMFWDDAQNGYEITSIHGGISYDRDIHGGISYNRDFNVTILYTCKRKTDGKIFTLTERFISECKKIE
jgi:Asp-tRNA(Asn)/Glu-tRNA(Gln) amidotransferase B subunit